MDNLNADLSMITLQEAEMKKEKIPRSVIDYNKREFTSQEKHVISKEVDVIREKYPNYIPIVVRTSERGNRIDLTKRKFLVGGEITVGQFLFIIRKKINSLRPSESIFLFVNNTLPVSSRTLAGIYSEHMDKDTKMLFMMIAKENTFGIGN